MTDTLQSVIDKLINCYDTPEPPNPDPFQLIILENIGYLVDDVRRTAAFTALEKEVGLRPTDILAASTEVLTKFTKMGGIHAEVRSQRLKEIANIVLDEFDGDLSVVLDLPAPKAIKALKKFPAIGEPGAAKILLFTRSYPLLALDSNGLRVMLRLGFGEEKKNYAASYKSVKEATANEIGTDFDFLISTHQLLRQHGKEICKTNNPRCDECPLWNSCEYRAQLLNT